MDDLSAADQLCADEVQGIYVQKTLFFFLIHNSYNHVTFSKMHLDRCLRYQFVGISTLNVIKELIVDLY